VDNETAAIQTAVATKFDVSNWATLGATLGNGSIADIAAFTDANVDKIYGWDDSASAAIQFGLSTGLTTSGTNLLIDTAVVPRLNVVNAWAAGNTVSPASFDTTGASNYLAFTSSGVAKGYLGYGAGVGGSTNSSSFSMRSEGNLHLLSGGSSSTLILDAANTLAGSSIMGVAFSDFARLSQTNTFTIGQVIDSASASNSYLRYKVGGVDKGFVALGDGVGGTAGNLTVRAENGLDLMSNGANIRLAINSSGNFDFKAGTVTTTGSSASEVGFKGIPVVDFRGSSHTLQASDNGKHIIFNSGATLTVPAGLPIGFACTTQQCQSSGSMTVAQSSTTIYWSGTDFTSGNRVINRAGVASIVSYDTNVFLISGSDIS
jgi:hypothetical protein